MRAVVREGGRARLSEVPAPIPKPGEVLVEVELAAVCRTDLRAARGLIPIEEPRILGHEFCGRTEEMGRVCVDPLLACGRCSACERGHRGACRGARFLGLHEHGAFAEMIAVPQRNLHPIPEEVDPRRAVYAEPVAAALAVLRAPVKPADRGLIIGRGRIATLIERVLAAHGFAEVRTSDRSGEHGQYDFVVETDPGELASAMAAVRAGGVIVLRSRARSFVPLDLESAVAKEVTLAAVNYGDFARAIELVSSASDLPLEDLFGATLSLAELVEATAGDSEEKKLFVDPKLP